MTSATSKVLLWVILILAVLILIPLICGIGMMGGGMMMPGRMGHMGGGRMMTVGGVSIVWMLLLAALLVGVIVLMVRSIGRT